MEGLIFGGDYLRREICVSKSIGLALQLEVNLPFLLRFTLYLRAIFRVQAPGGLYLEGRFNGRFFALPVWGAYIFGGAFAWRVLFSEFYGNLSEKFDFCKRLWFDFIFFVKHKTSFLTYNKNKGL